MQHKQTALGLASLGRGPDTELVHMTKGEVAGLQQLAMSHGGSLTINPQTGLPEAGILSSLLPMALGFALGPAGFGLMGAGMAGLTVGGIATLASGSLSKGLMAGLGAYGGAGLGEALSGAGAQAISSSAGVDAANAFSSQAATPVAGLEAGAGMGANAGAASATPPSFYDAMGQVGSSAAPPIAPPTATAPPPTTTSMPELNASGVTRGDFIADAATNARDAATPLQRVGAGFTDVTSSFGNAKDFAMANKGSLGAMGVSALSSMEAPALSGIGMAQTPSLIRPYKYSREKVPSAFGDVPGAPYSSQERRYFNDAYTAGTPYTAPGPEYRMASGGPVEDMSNTDFAAGGEFSTGAQDAGVNPYTGAVAYASGGISNLGDYSDGGRLLRGPGDGVSDDIPAVIGGKQPARLADGEFVIPARLVSELGNGSTEAGARQLYAMMDRIQKARKKSIGKDRAATNSNASALLPA